MWAPEETHRPASEETVFTHLPYLFIPPFAYLFIHLFKSGQKESFTSATSFSPPGSGSFPSLAKCRLALESWPEARLGKKGQGTDPPANCQLEDTLVPSAQSAFSDSFSFSPPSLSFSVSASLTYAHIHTHTHTHNTHADVFPAGRNEPWKKTSLETHPTPS